MRFRHLLMTIIFIVIISPLCSQDWRQGWPGGNLTCTVTTVPTGRPGQTNTYWSNYVWKDPSGGVHAFPSNAQSREVWQRKSGQIPRGGTPEYELVSIPVDTLSNDGFYRFRGIELRGPITAYGDVYPKYRVLSIIYAPPGERSYVSYGSSSSIGSKSSVSETMSRSFGTSTSFSAIVGGSISNLWKQTIEDYYSCSLTSNQSFLYNMDGPYDSMKGLDHDQDAFLLWLNPRVSMARTSGTNGTWSFGLDPRSPVGTMDTVIVYVRWLKNPSLMETEAPPVVTALKREWAGPDGALTNWDYAELLKLNPFWNGSGIIDSIRYQPMGNQVILYQPPPLGGQPFTTVYTIGDQVITTIGKNASTSHAVSYQLQAGAGNIGLSISGNWEWVYRVSRESTEGYGHTAAASITGPPTGYSGPIRFQIYKDNIFGTFMFAPIY